MSDTPPEVPLELETMWTVLQVASAYQVAAETVRDWIKQGDLPALKLGNEWRIKNSDLVAFTKARYSTR